MIKKEFLLQHEGTVTYVCSLLLLFLLFLPFFIEHSAPEGDASISQLPHFVFFQRALEQNESILWNPHNAGGFHVFASVNGFFFPPHYIVLKLFDALTAVNILLVFSGATALWGFIRLMREIGLSQMPSIIGGLSYLIGEFSFLIHAPSVAYAIAVLPLTALIVFRIYSRNRKVFYTSVLTLILGLSWLAVFPHFMIMITLFLLAFASYLSIRDGKFRIVYMVLLAAVLGGMIGLIQLLPTFIASQYSVRGFSEIPFKELTDRAIRPQDLLRFFFPPIYDFVPLYVSDGIHKGPEALLYLGFFPFIFFIYAFFRRGKYTNFLRWTFLVALATSVQFSPFFLLLTHIPIIGDFRVPSRYMLIGSFAAAALAAIGAQSLRARSSEELCKKYKKIVLRLSTAMLCTMFIASALFIFIVKSIALKTSPYFKTVESAQILELSTHWPKTLAFISMHLVIPFVIMLVGVLIYYFFVKKNFSMVLPLIILTVITGAELFLIFYTSEAVRHRFSYPEKTVYSAFLHDHPGRALQIKGAGLTNISRDTNLFLGYDYYDYYEKLIQRNAEQAMMFVGSGGSNESYGLWGRNNWKLDESGNLTLGVYKKLLNFLGIKYLITGATTTDPDFKKIDMGEGSGESSLYENMRSAPILYFTDRVVGTSATDDEAFGLYAGSDFSDMYVKCSDCDGVVGRYSGGELLIEKSGNAVIEAHAVSQGKNFVVFSQNYSPGWSAYVDGKKTEIFVVNSVFMGISLAEGTHEIAFRFTYPEFILKGMREIFAGTVGKKASCTLRGFGFFPWAAYALDVDKYFTTYYGDITNLQFMDFVPWTLLKICKDLDDCVVPEEEQEKYDAFQKLMRNVRARTDGFETKRYVSVSPLDQNLKGIAADWLYDRKSPQSVVGNSFADPEIRSLYKKWVQYLIKKFHPDYFSQAMEFNLYADNNQEDFANMVSLLSEIRNETRGTKVIGPTVQWETYKGKPLVLDWDALGDGFAITTYPQLMNTVDVSSALVPEQYDFEKWGVNVGEKPLFISATGIPYDYQKKFLTLLFNLRDTHDLRGVIWLHKNDDENFFSNLPNEMPFSAFHHNGLYSDFETKNPGALLWESSLACK